MQVSKAETPQTLCLKPRRREASGHGIAMQVSSVYTAAGWQIAVLSASDAGVEEQRRVAAAQLSNICVQTSII